MLALVNLASAASVLEFPRLVLDGETITGIALVNSAGEEAPVTLTVYGLDGAVLAVTQITLPAGSQVAQLASELFPQLPTGSSGWIRAASEVNGLTGFFLFLDRQLRQFDGADLPIRSRSLVFNQIRQGNGFSTELNLINTSNQAVSVEITIQAGQTVGTLVRELPARGGLRQEVSDLFQLDELPDGGLIRAEADRDLVGFEVVRSGDGDLLGLNARSRAERLNTLYFPQAAVLGAITSRLGLANYSSRDVSVQVTFHRPDGSLYQSEVQQNPVSVDVPAGRGVSRDLADLFGFTGPRTLEGWLEVSTSSPSINGHLTYRIDPAGATAAVAPVGQGATEAVFSHIATTRGFFTGIAALNPGQVAADLRIVALSRAGQRLGTFDTVLPPGARVSRLLTDLIPAASGQDGGLIWVSSNQPIFASSLFGTNRGSILANIPPQNALPSFQPDSGLARIRVLPGLAVAGPGEARQFQAEGAEGVVRWSVQGVEGGNPEAGLISSGGEYQAPAETPSLPLVVTAVSGAGIGSATVDIVSPRVFHQETGAIVAATYLPRRQRLVFAREIPGESPSTELFELGPGLQSEQLALLADERVSALAPVVLAEGEFLLAAGLASGRLLLIDPDDSAVTTLVSGLNAPQGLGLDPLTGGLLVAESDRITLLSRGSLGLRPLSSEENARKVGEKATLLRLDGLRALAVDQCSGQIYATTSSGDRLLQLNRDNGAAETVIDGLAGLSEIQILYRQGVSCPQARHLLLAEAEADQVSLYLASSGELMSPWTAGSARATAFLPPQNPYSTGAALLWTTSQEEFSQFALVDLQQLYRAFPANPPRARLEDGGTPPGPDLFLSNVATNPGGLAAITVSYRAASAGQPGGEGLAAMAFAVAFDPEQFSLDPADSDGDGIPDAIQSILPGDFTLFVSAQPEAGRVEIVIADFSRPFSSLPSGDLVSIVLRALEGQSGSIDVSISEQPQASAANSQGQVRQFNEILPGVVFVQP